MSYVNEITVVQNDYGYNLEFQVTDANGNPVDLTGADVKIFIGKKGAATAKVSGTCTVTNAAQGICQYTVQRGDFNAAPQTYDVELELNYPDRQITARGVTVNVVLELPETT
ncbi:MAG: BppU family phage baseplate upper protein [Candidatus Bathyarchaeia archaeon]